MVRRIGEKINRALQRLGRKKRELAHALGISPQAVSDLATGRTLPSIPHLEALVGFTGLRAEYWLDDDRLDPDPSDLAAVATREKLAGLARCGLLQTPDPGGLFARLRVFLAAAREPYAARFGEPLPEELRALGWAPRDSARGEARGQRAPDASRIDGGEGG